MKIFITGTTGFIGKNLVEFYNGHEIYEYTRGDNINLKLYEFKPNVIINCAAEIYKSELMYQSNIFLVQKILDYVKNNPTTKLIQIGSSAEYGPASKATAETDRINPVNMYQATKGAATLLCQGYAKEYNLDISIARPYSVYGKYEKPHRLFPRLWKAFILNESMTLYQGYHDFIYIDDFIRGLDILLHTKTNGDIINFGSGLQYSNNYVLENFKKITKNKNSPIIFENKFAKSFESLVWRCDPVYAFETYGFQTEYSLDEGIKEFLKTANYRE